MDPIFYIMTIENTFSKNYISINILILSAQWILNNVVYLSECTALTVKNSLNYLSSQEVHIQHCTLPLQTACPHWRYVHSDCRHRCTSLYTHRLQTQVYSTVYSDWGLSDLDLDVTRWALQTYTGCIRPEKRNIPIHSAVNELGKVMAEHFA